MKIYKSKAFSYNFLLIVDILVFIYLCFYLVNFLNSEITSYIVFITYIFWRLILINILAVIWVIKESKRMTLSNSFGRYKEVILFNRKMDYLINSYEKNFGTSFYSNIHKILVASPGRPWIPHSKNVKFVFYHNKTQQIESGKCIYNILVTDKPISENYFKLYDGVIYQECNSIYIEFNIKLKQFYSLDYLFIYRIFKLLGIADSKVLLIGDVLAISTRLSNLNRKVYNKKLSI